MKKLVALSILLITIPAYAQRHHVVDPGVPRLTLADPFLPMSGTVLNSNDPVTVEVTTLAGAQNSARALAETINLPVWRERDGKKCQVGTLMAPIAEGTQTSFSLDMSKLKATDKLLFECWPGIQEAILVNNKVQFVVLPTTSTGMVPIQLPLVLTDCSE